MDTLTGEECPFCSKKELTLTEDRREVPFFGPVYIYSMTCTGCGAHKADVEVEMRNDPVKCTIEVDSEEDMKIRVVKSSEATIKIPRIATVTPSEASNGYVTNIEGILNRIIHNIKSAAEGEEDKSVRKKAKNQIKKLQKVVWGQEKLKITIEDPSGNSAIISEKTKISKL